MFTTFRTSVLALSAIASIGVATLVAASTSADARPSFGGRPGVAFARFSTASSVLQRHPGAAFNRFTHPVSVVLPHPGAANWVNNSCSFGRCGNYRPYVYGAPVVTTTYAPAPGYAAPAPTYAAAPAPATNCLTKQYTQDGQVVFSDVCTNETATGPAGPQAPAPQQQ